MSARCSMLGVLTLLVALTEVIQAADEVDDLLQDQPKNPYDFNDYRDHSCKRPCQKDAPPMTCHYYFLLEHFTTISRACQDCPRNQSQCFLSQCVPADGRSRGILTVNRMLPGPTIDVCKGDTVVVVVDNRMVLGAGTSIHWHGLRQFGSPHMDGTNLVTQCPVNAYSKMVYRFKAADSGTYFWHSHSSIQRSDGLFGGLVVRTPYELDPHRHLYDYDLPEHYIILADWSEKSSGDDFAQNFHGREGAEPTSILINGLGTAEDGPVMPYPVFRVKSGRRYRFRVAFNGIFNCPVHVSVDGHTLLMIATDGRNVEPLEVDAFIILSGERYDFVLKTKHEVKDNFWIRFIGQGRCNGIVQTAILRYYGGSESPPEGDATDNITDNERILNGLGGVSSETSFQVVDLQALGPDKDVDVLKKKPDKQFYISLAASTLVDDRFKPPSQPHATTQKPPTVPPINHQLNYISSYLPSSPPLTQLNDIPQDELCNNDTVRDDCSQVFCSCVHLLKLDLGDVVEIVLVSFTRTITHPMHMHGHSFRVVTMQSFKHDLTVKEVKDMDKKGHIHRRTSHAPYKDTIAVSSQSVVIIRFRADNPGFWFFHCHIEFHAELGMALILQTGELDEMPKTPKGFPTCGNWRSKHGNWLHSAELTDVGAEKPTEVGDSLLAFISSIVAGILLGVVACVLCVACNNKCRGRLERSGLYKLVTSKDNKNYQSFDNNIANPESEDIRSANQAV